MFETYDKTDLIRIVESRIGRNVVHPKAIELIASKVAATSGDARKVLDHVAKAVEKCRAKLPQERLCSPVMEHAKPVVTLGHAMMAIRETVTKFVNRIEELPQLSKATLCVATTLARILVNSNNRRPATAETARMTQLTLGMLKNYCMEAFGREVMSDGDIDIVEFLSLVETLVDEGLLTLSAPLQSESFHDLSMLPIHVDLPLEDVQTALESKLLKQPFYSNLVERVKRAAS